MNKNINKRNIILFFIITGWIRVLFILIPMGGVIWCNHTNCVSTDTEYIKK